MPRWRVGYRYDESGFYRNIAGIDARKDPIARGGDDARILGDEHFDAGREPVAEAQSAAEATGPQHRLLMDRLPWSYVRSL